MNDPWDVKSVRQSGLYVSCMKINGSPLLPPVLSQECRKEMQYYKLLAQEVEKRITLLKTFIDDSDSASSVDKLEELCAEHNQKDEGRTLISNLSTDFDVKVEKVKAIHLDQDIMPSSLTNQTAKVKTKSDCFDNITSNVTIVKNVDTTHLSGSPKVFIGFNVSINDSGNQTIREPSIQVEATNTLNYPEKDTNPIKNQCVSTPSNKEHVTSENENIDFGIVTSKINNGLDKVTTEINCVASYFPESILKEDCPSSLGSKSFTGSLNDIYTESSKGIQSPRLIRQRSYTVLEPSPQLIAHLEVQSLSKGVDVTSISMSESCSNLNSAVKKRRSWDLETAKVKWSSMARELNQKKIQNIAGRKSKQAKPKSKEAAGQNTAKIVTYNRGKEITESQKMISAKLEQNTEKTPVKNNLILITNSNNHSQSPKEHSPYKINTRTYKLPKRDEQKLSHKESSPEKLLPVQSTTPSLKSSVDDPATRVRELYEKVQRQQSMQMATLMEKQKREQNLLRQMFEEQNTILYKQLKSICPKQPIEAKEAWAEKSQDVDRGPVSLSQLINHKESPSDDLDTSSTLTDISNHTGQCEALSVKNKNPSNNFKRSFSKVKPKTVTHIEASQHFASNASDVLRDNSLQKKSLHSHTNQYNTTSERDYEDIILTDRTNDTMADLNFTLTSDDSDTFVSNDMCLLNAATGSRDPSVYNTKYNVDLSVQNSSHRKNIKSNDRKTVRQLFANPSPKERDAATKIVAYAKGYLVRRLMHTERVQSTVQTIRDALVCALQLHTDQAGIRGADIDLHRRLIQQITAACYNLHETFVLSSPAERCAIISSDRARKHALANRPPRRNSARTPDIMSQSDTCVLPARRRTSSERTMTQSNYENYNDSKLSSTSRARQLTKNVDHRRRPWR